MKKVLLLAVTAMISSLSFAQTKIATNSAPAKAESHFRKVTEGVSAKLTAVGDTVYQSHINTAAGTDTVTYYTWVNDTGAVFGMNAFGDKGYAERYDINGASATYKVIGVIARFSGTYQPASTKTVDFHCWNVGPKSPITATMNNSGMPSTSMATVNKSITQLGIGSGSTIPDTSKIHYFTTPTAYLADTFFVGYQMTYTWAGAAGDTIGLYSNLDGERSESPVTTLVTGDTTLNNVSVSQRASGTWQDNSIFTGVFNNMHIFPLMIVGPGTVGVEGSITRNALTFYGTFPNPAGNTTNVKFALAGKTDVTIEMMDMAGRTLSTSTQTLFAGDHTIPVNTAALASGNYICLVRTSEGDGMATQLTIAK